MHRLIPIRLMLKDIIPTADLVFFEDGSHWGEDSGRNLAKIESMRASARRQGALCEE